MNVSASDKGTGKSSKITITNEKGRLNKEDIERMVNEAEKYKGEDEKMRRRIEAKNAFENYCFQMKNTSNDEKIREKLSEDDKKTIDDLTKEGLKWIEDHPMAEPEEIEEEQKKIEGKFNPIMVKMYQATGAAPGGAQDTRGEGYGPEYGEQASGATKGANVEDLD